MPPKKVTGIIRLQIKAGQANPAPPIGPALGQHGVNIMAFCKEFNAATKDKEQGLMTPVVITVYQDKSFTFLMKEPPVAVLIKKAAGIETASGVPNREKAGKITKSQVRKIAEQKMKDLNARTVEAGMLMVEGTARSMGVDVIGD